MLSDKVTPHASASGRTSKMRKSDKFAASPMEGPLVTPAPGAGAASTARPKGRPRAADYFGMAGTDGVGGDSVIRACADMARRVRVLPVPELGAGGRGVFAPALPQGTIMGVYPGIHKNKAQVDDDYGKGKGPPQYLMQFKDGTFIDAAEVEGGNDSPLAWPRFVNSAGPSQKPNCCFFEDDGTIYIVTTKHVNDGEQLLVDYNGSGKRLFVWAATGGDVRVDLKPCVAPAEWHELVRGTATRRVDRQTDVFEVITVNVNSLRSADEKGLVRTLLDRGPSVLAMQEIKLHEGVFTGKVKHRGILNQFSEHGYYASLNMCTRPKRKGLHGTAIFSLEKPVEVRTKMGDAVFDQEGRIQIAIFAGYILVNIYAPQPGMDAEHVPKRERFLNLLAAATTNLRAEFPDKPVVLVGDTNVAPRPCDAWGVTPGATPLEQTVWGDFKRKAGFADVWERDQHKDRCGDPDCTAGCVITRGYTWWYTAAQREANQGLRLDQVLVHNGNCRIKVGGVVHLQQIEGSDHCPVRFEIDFGQHNAEGDAEGLQALKPLKNPPDDDEVDIALAVQAIGATQAPAQTFRVTWEENSERKARHDYKPPVITVALTHNRGGTPGALEMKCDEGTIVIHPHKLGTRPRIVFTVRGDDSDSVRGTATVGGRALTGAPATRWRLPATRVGDPRPHTRGMTRKGHAIWDPDRATQGFVVVSAVDCGGEEDEPTLRALAALVLERVSSPDPASPEGRTREDG